MNIVKERRGSIYVLHNAVNDKEYVGQTIRKPEQRWAGHIKCAFVTNDRRPLYRAIRKYGLENFTAEVIWDGPESKLNAAERRFIRQRRTFIDTGWGYNLTTGGDHYKSSKQSRRKIAEAARARFLNPLNRLFQSFRIQLAYVNDPHSWVERGVKLRGRVNSPKSIARTVAANLGRKNTLETLRLMSTSAVRRYKNPVERQKTSLAVRDGYASKPEMRRRCSKRALVLWADPVVRAKHLKAAKAARVKQSVALIAYWARKREERKALNRAA